MFQVSSFFILTWNLQLDTQTKIYIIRSPSNRSKIIATAERTDR